MATQIQLRRDSAVNWVSNNPVLAEGEMGIETDGLGTPTVLSKIGNGVDGWNSLPYQDTGVTVDGDMTKAVYDPQNIESDTFDRGNHTGTQEASTISDFDTEVSNNTDVVANTAKRSYPSADETKLAGIEDGATADQTNAEIKVAYEANADTNAFTDAEKSKVASTSGTNTGDQDLSNLQPILSEGAFVDGDKTKLDGIENGAEVNPTNSETKVAYEANSNTNAYTDSEKTTVSNQSGTNTGDEDTSSIQSKRPLKTVGGVTVEGSGDIPIPDTATWGGINGTLSDQTDLQAELDEKLNESANPTATEKGGIKAVVNTSGGVVISITGADIT